mgnify:CR=1 FL=1
MTPSLKALVVTVLFALAGVAGFMMSEKTPTTLPLAIFYATLTLNSYFSIKLFSSIVPPDDKKQWVVDGLLVVSYLALAWFISNPIFFFLAILFLFIIAAFKYTLLLGTISHPKLLKKKIFIDLCGVLMGAIAVTLAGFGFVIETAWAVAIAFVLANVLLLFIRPMYKIID